MFTITLPIANFLDQEKDPIRENKTRAIQNPTPDQVREATNLAKARAAELIKQLNDGADFATLAAQNPGDSHATNGGRWPKLKRGTLASKEWENLVFSTPPNTIGPLLVTDPDKPLLAGVRITKVGDVTPGHVIPFSEAQAGIESDMKNEQFNDLSRDYITKMRNKSAVEGVERMVDAAIDAAISRYLTP